MNSPGCDQDAQNMNTVYGKLAAIKITNVLYSNKYCCICLEMCDGMLGLDTCGVVDGGEKNLMILTLREMLEAIFDDTVLYILRDYSDHLCPACTESIKKTLSFIQKTKTQALIFAKYFANLNRLTNNVLQLSNTESIESIPTVVLNVSLDNISQDVQREGVKRKQEDACPHDDNCKKAKVTNRKEKDKPEQTKVNIEREQSANGNDSGKDKASPGKNDKDSQQLSLTSEPIHVTKECPVCGKRPCIHENYLAAFEKRQRNGKIECPECKELLYTLNDLNMHVNMDHFKRKPTIRDVCKKIFSKDNATKILQLNVEKKSHEYENRDQFLHEVVNDVWRLPKGEVSIVQDDTENDNEAMEEDEEISPTHLEQRDVPCGHEVPNKESDDRVLLPAASIKYKCSPGTVIQEETAENIVRRETEQKNIITDRNLNNEEHRNQNAIEEKTGIHIDSETIQHAISSSLVQNNIFKNDKALCIRPDVTNTSNIQKKVLIGTLKKDTNSSKTPHKSVTEDSASSIKGTCSTGTVLQEETDKNIEQSETEQTIISTDRNLNNKEHREQNVIEQKTGVHIVSEPIRRAISNNFVQNNIYQNDKTLCIKPDVTNTSDIQKNVLTGILKKYPTASKKRHKSVTFGDCPTLSDWRKAAISANTGLNVEDKMNVEKKTMEEAKEHEKSSSTNIEQDISKIQKGIEILNSKKSSAPKPAKKEHVNKTAPRELSVVLIDVLKYRKFANSQPQTSVYDDRYKILMTDIKNDKIRRFRSKFIRNPDVTETTVVNKSDFHVGTGMNVGKTLQADSLKTNQGTSLTCSEKPISGIFESTKASHKNDITENKRDLPEVSVCLTDVLQKDNGLNQNAQTSNVILKEVVTDLSRSNINNPVPPKAVKCTQYEKLNVSPNKKDCITTHNVHDETNIKPQAVQVISNDIQKEVVADDASKEKNVYSKPQDPIKISKADGSGNKNVIQKKGLINIISNQIIVNAKPQDTIKSTVIAPKVVVVEKESINISKVVNLQKSFDLKKLQDVVEKTKGLPLIWKEKIDKSTLRANDKNVLNLEGKSLPAQEVLVNAKEQSICKGKIEKNIVMPNDAKVVEIRSPPNEKDTVNTRNRVVDEQTNIQLKTAQEIVEKCKGLSTSKEMEDFSSLRPIDANVSKMESKIHARIIDRKMLRREIVKKTIVKNLQKKNGNIYQISQKPVQKNTTEKDSFLIVNEKQNIVPESDESTVEKEEPVSIGELIEEAKLMEKNEKQLLTYEKQRRNRTFECPECKKMLYSLKGLIAHVNKNNCKKNTSELNSKESQSVTLKDHNIKRLKSVVKIRTLANKPANEHSVPKRICTDEIGKILIPENDCPIIHESATTRTAQMKSLQNKSDVKCPQCNIPACRHETYRQAYDKLRRNKIIICPECEYTIYSLSDFLEHVNKNHSQNEVMLRDIFYEEFRSTFINTYKKSEELKKDRAPVKEKVLGDTEMGLNAKCGEYDATSEKETPMEFEEEFLNEELEEKEKDETGREVTNKDMATGIKSNEPVQCHKCRLLCPNEEAYKQHRQEHELLVKYKEKTAELQIELMDMMKKGTDNMEIEGNKRIHKCGTCGEICKSRTQLTLHLKSTGHVLQGTISCPQCVKRPCKHEKFLCAYEKQNEAGIIECYECKNTHSSLNSFIAHVNNEHFSIKRVKCDVCDKMVRTNLFEKHNKNCHKQHEPAKCAKCPALSVNEEAYMVHNLEHEFLELNEVSTKTALTEKSKAATKEREDSEIIDEHKVYECGTCGKIFRHRSWLKLHLNTTDHVVKRELVCPQCSKRPCKHEDYLLAFENHNENHKLECLQCKDSLDSLSVFIAHVNQDHLKKKPIKCDCCKEEFYLKSQLITHLKVHEPKLTCEHCNCEFRRSLFRKHKIICQYVKKSVKCAKCPALFPNEKAYTVHKKEHPELLENAASTSVDRDTEVEAKNKSKKTKYDCPICQCNCSRREKLSTHLNTAHAMESRRTCSGCVKVFATRQKYLDHRVAKGNECNKCNFFNEKALDRRQKGFNNREKRSCNICRKTVAPGATAVHLRMHARKPYPCHGCSWRFKSSSARAQHVIKDHSRKTSRGLSSL